MRIAVEAGDCYTSAISHISTVTYHRMAHVTGPGCVLVSLRFGVMEDDSPRVVLRGTPEEMARPLPDVDAYVKEALEGVAMVNEVHGSAVAVEEIEILPGDYPTPGQVRHCARKLAESYIGADK